MRSIGHRPEGGDVSPVAASRRDRVLALGHEAAGVRRKLAGPGERHFAADPSPISRMRPCQVNSSTHLRPPLPSIER